MELSVLWKYHLLLRRVQCTHAPILVSSYYTSFITLYLFHRTIFTPHTSKIISYRLQVVKEVCASPFECEPVHPQSYTLHPIAYTCYTLHLNPKPYTLHPTPYTPNAEQ